LAFPILLILFLGLIELALTMRAKLVLTNANREAARLASRGTFTDEQVAEWALTAFTGQLPAKTEGAEANTGIIVTRFYTPPGAEEATYDTPIYVTGTMTYTTETGEVKTTPSQIDPESYKDQLQADNAAYLTANDVVVVETYYHHHQVLHAPLVEWVFPEPIILYVRTAMRIASPKLED
jgi:Flp pilus assembly protein TadG